MASVWVVLVERGVEEGADLAVFWRRVAASEAALAHMADRWPWPGDVPDDVEEAIEQYNRARGVDEHLLLAEFEIHGHEHFDGDVDDRPRCALCGEPLVLADASDAESWVHAEDANDWADHTAELDPPPELSAGRGGR